MKLDAVRKFARALSGTTEEPHHQIGSFRVHGKIFATFPPDEQHLHVFVAETRREQALALYPESNATRRPRISSPHGTAHPQA